MRFQSNERELDFSDVLILPKTSTLTSRSDVSLDRTFKLKHAGWSWTGVPIVVANMDTVGTFEMAEELLTYNMSVALHKHYPVNKLVDNLNNYLCNCFYSMGIAESDMNKLIEYSKMNDGFPSMLCVDVANGYIDRFVSTITKLRELAPNTFIMAGNVVSPEKTEQIIMAGADCVKIGIGPGSVCTTRIIAGVGRPQLSAIIECADAAHGLNGLICGDGGCTTPGDIAKAFGAGADFVMVAGMFSGTDESSGDPVCLGSDGRAYAVAKGHPSHTHMKFYGMSSKEANDEYSGGLSDYRTAEGKTVYVPRKGSVHDVVRDILGGLRSTLTYTGSKTLKELSKRTTFVLVNNQHNRVFG